MTPPSPGDQSPGLGRWPFSETAVVRKILSPQTMGCDQPTPGSFTFQARCSSADHASGCAAPVATPLPFDPRNRGQLSAAVAFIAQAQRHAPSTTRCGIGDSSAVQNEQKETKKEAVATLYLVFVIFVSLCSMFP